MFKLVKWLFSSVNKPTTDYVNQYKLVFTTYLLERPAQSQIMLNRIV